MFFACISAHGRGRSRRALALALALLGCPAPAPPPRPAPLVLIVGCEALDGPRCVAAPGQALTLWVRSPRDAHLVLEWDGVAADPGWVFAEDGLRGTFSPTRPVGELTVRDRDLDWRWTVTLAPAPELAPALARARALRGERRLPEALAALDEAMPGLDGAGEVEALMLRGALLLDRERFDDAVAAYERAYPPALARGLERAASRIAVIAAFTCIESSHDLACARRWLDRHAALTLPEARVRHDYIVGLLADQHADWRTAIRSFTDYVRHARALGLTTDLASGLLKLGAIYSRLGDTARARALYREMLALPGLSPTNAAKASQSDAYLKLEARLRGEPGDDPAPQFLAALAHFERGGADPQGPVAAEIRINLALAHLAAGELQAARAVLDALAPPNHQQRRWKALLLGRLELAEGNPSAALRRLDDLARAADEASDHARAWDAAVFAGEALERLGDLPGALARYRRAAALHAVRLAAVADGAEVFAAEGDRGARRLVALLVRLGRHDEAACAARTARARPFAVAAALTRDPAALRDYHRRRRELDEQHRRAWERPRREREQQETELRAARRHLEAELDELLFGQVATDMLEETASPCPGPPPGAVMLVYYPGERGYHAFAVDADGVVAAELPADRAPGLAERAAELLGPFAAKLARAERIEVLASGDLSREPFHALPWRGRLLVERAAVVYRLDLPRAAAAAAPRSALQLTPPSNLPEAPREIESVAQALRERGVAVTTRAGDEPDLHARLAVDLLHYVGHARADGWDSALELGDDRRLGARELLAGPAPAIAVLGGCETGLPDPRAHGGGISLAHALLLAGSAAVIGTDAKVSDDLASSLVPALIAALADGVEPAEALRRAQRAHLGRDGWARFRAFAP